MEMLKVNLSKKGAMNYRREK